MFPIVEFCMSNLASGTHPVLEALEKDPNLEVVEYGCLGFCTSCAENSYALVDGEVITGADNDELLANIYSFLEEEGMI
ncbi:uncharacterized protein YuzB (UPF0349 family) [Geomicrobium halophilum]|uniref:Uncharacterized protein YuzB (UPF0349 family) n=1 Tax=Geomicrobium halophilum TaxID=549000 RepID=A0A841PSN3_9BACL|nr:YuzB family protein [Geomicrobium halophilum]MBB6450196.1 uncharacterized protein YuzB (UPF0349 family) [Geomicrobium halophilum]